MGEWIKIGRLDEFAAGAGRRVEVAGHRLAVFMVEDRVYVIGDRCSHAEASLAEGELFDFDVECPRHGSEFDIRTGKPGALPATRPVPVYEVRVDGSDVLVSIVPEEE